MTDQGPVEARPRPCMPCTKDSRMLGNPALHTSRQCVSTTHVSKKDDRERAKYLIRSSENCNICLSLLRLLRLEAAELAEPAEAAEDDKFPELAEPAVLDERAELAEPAEHAEPAELAEPAEFLEPAELAEPAC